MTEDPDFTTFWAVYPRKDRKIEARLEWQRAAHRFGAESVILTAARYCAQVRSLPHDDILPAVAWLPGLTEPEPPPRPDGVAGLDPERMGRVLLTACFVSWQLGHATAAGTVRDYIAPHGPYDAEHEFVYQVLLGASPRDLITEDEALTWLKAVPLPALPP